MQQFSAVVDLTLVTAAIERSIHRPVRSISTAWIAVFVLSNGTEFR